MNGQLEYTETTVSIFFPKGNICCGLCRLMQTLNGRDMCMRTAEIISDRRGRGIWCPLKELDKKEGENE